MNFIQRLLLNSKENSRKKHLENLLGTKPGRYSLYETALSHRSIKEGSSENNERLEYLGDAVLSTVVADYLFKKYPYKGEGFLTEMRSKMVNRQQLNDIALRMGIKRLTHFNKFDNSLKGSQIFGNTLEAIVGAYYLDKGYEKTQQWIITRIILPHLYVEDLENIDINLKNRLIGWASKNGKELGFETLSEKMESGRRVFTIGVVLEGNVYSEGKGFNKKDASQIAAQLAIEKLGL